MPFEEKSKKDNKGKAPASNTYCGMADDEERMNVLVMTFMLFAIGVNNRNRFNCWDRKNGI